MSYFQFCLDQKNKTFILTSMMGPEHDPPNSDLQLTGKAFALLLRAKQIVNV